MKEKLKLITVCVIIKARVEKTKSLTKTIKQWKRIQISWSNECEISIFSKKETFMKKCHNLLKIEEWTKKLKNFGA